MNDTQLARYYDKKTDEVKTVTIGDYNNLVDQQDRNGLAEFLYNRLDSRYLLPHRYEGDEYAKKYKNGFSMMASYCLLIETIQSFRNGWGTSDRRSGDAFKQFFMQTTNFADLKPDADEIYKHIRCGILHQGETTKGWKITRQGGSSVYTPETKTLDAIQFGVELEKELLKYASDLQGADWDSSLWDNFRVKMRKLIEQCSTT